MAGERAGDGRVDERELDLRSVLRELGGTSNAQALDGLVQAIKMTAIEEAFDYVTGETPLPSNMTDARALRLRRLCHYAVRPLTTREIEIVFRVSPSTARSVNTRMHATYPREMQHLRAAMDAAMRADATVAKYVDRVTREARYRISFGSPSSREHADTLLAEAAIIKGVERPNDTTLTLPMQVALPDGTTVDAVRTVLGL